MRGAVLVRVSGAPAARRGGAGGAAGRAAGGRRGAARGAPAAELMRLLRFDGRLRWGALAARRGGGGPRHRRRGGAVSRVSSAPRPGAAVRRRSCCSSSGSPRSSCRSRSGCVGPAAGSRSASAGCSCARSRACRDRYFQSRPISDMAERAHLAAPAARAADAGGGHRARGDRDRRGRRRRSSGWIRAARRSRSCSRAAMLLIPLAGRPAPRRARPAHAQPRGRARALLSSTRFLGLVAIRTHGAEPALAREHRERLGEWARAARGRAAGGARRRGGVRRWSGSASAPGCCRTSSRAPRAPARVRSRDRSAGRLLGALAADARVRARAARPAAPRAAQPHAAPGRAARRPRGARAERRASPAPRPATAGKPAVGVPRSQLSERPRGGGAGTRSSTIGALAIRAGRARRDRRRVGRRQVEPASGCCSAGTAPPRGRCGSTARRSTRARLEALRRRTGVGRSGGLALESLARRQPRLRPGRRRPTRLADALGDADLDEVVRRLPERRADAARRGGRAALGRRGAAGALRPRPAAPGAARW